MNNKLGGGGVKQYALYFHPFVASPSRRGESIDQLTTTSSPPGDDRLILRKHRPIPDMVTRERKWSRPQGAQCQPSSRHLAAAAASPGDSMAPVAEGGASLTEFLYSKFRTKHRTESSMTGVALVIKLSKVGFTDLSTT